MRNVRGTMLAGLLIGLAKFSLALFISVSYIKLGGAGSHLIFLRSQSRGSFTIGGGCRGRRSLIRCEVNSFAFDKKR